MSFRSFLLPCIAAMCLSACQNMPEPYAPPEQRQAFENFRPYRIDEVIQMSDQEAPAHFVSGILDLNGSWRWTAQRPTLRLTMRSIDHLHYLIDFTIPGVTFDRTGPVTLSFFVNHRLLDKVRYTSPGVKHFDKPVPDGWVEANQETTVAAEIDKLYVSKKGAAPLGFILTSLGLKQE
ncbi:MAG TPA: hypothetical protein VFW83_10525 [Bryobacteraceae bacterium]|nr:hypothetical protein [Bryobacteraceae bacterium]